MRRAPHLVPALLAAAIGLTALAGWVLERTELIQVRSDWAPVQFNTALALIACGVAVALLVSRWRRSAVVLAGLAAVLSALTFSQYLLGLDVGVDRLLYEPWTVRQSPYPGRMAPNAAIALVMTGVATIFLACGRMRFAAAALGSLTFTLGGAVVIGHMAGAPEFFTWGPVNQMALLTALAVTLLGTALVTAAFHAAPPEPNRAWWGPLLAGVAISAAGLVLWNALRIDHVARVEQALRSDARAARAELHASAALRVERLEYLAAFAAASGWRAGADWEADVISSVALLTGLEQIEWVRSATDVVVVAGDGRGLPTTAGSVEETMLQEAIDYIRETGSPALIGPIRLATAELGFKVIVPVPGPADALLAGVFPSQAIFAEGAPAYGIQSGLHLRVLCGGREVHRTPGPPDASAGLRAELALDSIPGPRPWSVVVTPSSGYGPRAGRELPEIVLGVSLSIALLLSLSAQFGQSQTARADRLEEAVQERTEDLSSALEELQKADAAKDRFITVLGHELRNPLGAILSAAELVERPDGARDRVETAAVIKRQVAQLGRIVDDLLDVSRITRGQLEMKMEPLDLGAVVAEAVESHRFAMEDRELALRFTRPDEPVPVEADAARVRQMIDNLLSNAARFSDPRGTIDVEVREAGGQAEVSVRDTGHGIEAGDLDRIFEPFVQSGLAVARDRLGLGLGLPIVKGLAESHGGAIRVSSEGRGAGAVFVLELPLTDRELPAAVAAPRAVDRSARPGRNRVLLVEDHRPAAQMMARLLTLAGYEVDVAATGPEGLESAGERRPDIVICDLGLPGMDGYEVAKNLRARPALSRVPLIAISGYGREEDVERAREAGFDRHLLKPVDPEALRELLASLSEERSAEGSAEGSPGDGLASEDGAGSAD